MLAKLPSVRRRGGGNDKTCNVTNTLYTCIYCTLYTPTVHVHVRTMYVSISSRNDHTSCYVFIIICSQQWTVPGFALYMDLYMHMMGPLVLHVGWASVILLEIVL